MLYSERKTRLVSVVKSDSIGWSGSASRLRLRTEVGTFCHSAVELTELLPMARLWRPMVCNQLGTDVSPVLARSSRVRLTIVENASGTLPLLDMKVLLS